MVFPDDKYEDFPCSVVAIGCASGKIVDVPVNSEGFATLRNANAEIRKHCNVAKYEYFKRNERVSLQEYSYNKTGRAIICVLGHFLYADFDKEEYYSFFDNDDDMVVAVWHLK